VGAEGGAYNPRMTPDTRDEVGAQEVTLQHVREIRRYNDWIFSHLQPHLGGRILELGCGIGTYSCRLRPFAKQLSCVDMDPGFVAQVRAMFGDDPGVAVEVGTVGGGLDFPPASFDVAVCLNVLEHIEDDAAALRQLRSWLAPGGKLVLQVPAHPSLYGSIDEALGHWRRYTRPRLADALERSGFELEAPPRHLYVLAAPGWWWFGRVKRRRVVPATTVRVANATVVVSRFLERVLPLRAGLTLIAVARVPELRASA
jgi:SAM-dependent methyltransferase